MGSMAWPKTTSDCTSPGAERLDGALDVVKRVLSPDLRFRRRDPLRGVGVGDLQVDRQHVDPEPAHPLRM